VDPSVTGAAVARDAALEYIVSTHGDRVTLPGGDWTWADVTGQDLVGGAEFRFTNGMWTVTVSYPVANPADIVYQIVATDEVTGFWWEGRVDTAGRVTELNVAVRAEAVFGGISFSYVDALAADVKVEVIPAVTEGPDWAQVPEHVRFSFEGYVLSGTFHEPQILVFPAENVTGTEMLEFIANSIRQMLAEEPDVPVGSFDAGRILPPMNAGHQIVTQVSYFDFQSGEGVRFVTQMGQSYVPINNHELFYTFQGMTEDGQYYVAAILPISHPSLPVDGSEIPGGDADAFADTYETYVGEIEARLGAEEAESFEPSIVLLDETIESLIALP
jgi:hypothetical protein